MDRYAHRAVPPADSLIRESEIPAEPQQALHEVIWEVSQYPATAEPTGAQRMAAQSLIDRSFASARAHAWHDADRGTADGFAPMHDSVTHWGSEPYILDDVLLDPDRPEFLM